MLDWTAYVIFIVVIGGIGTMEGPIIGAIIFYLMQRYLADFGASYLILLGTLGILIMLFAPKGLWGLVAERYGLTLFPTRRRLVIPAAGADRYLSRRVRCRGLLDDTIEDLDRIIVICGYGAEQRDAP